MPDFAIASTDGRQRHRPPFAGTLGCSRVTGKSCPMSVVAADTAAGRCTRADRRSYWV